MLCFWSSEKLNIIGNSRIFELGDRVVRDFLLMSDLHKIWLSVLTLKYFFCPSAFTGSFQGVIDVLCEWGSLFVLTAENKVMKDVSSNCVCSSQYFKAT